MDRWNGRDARRSWARVFLATSLTLACGTGQRWETLNETGKSAAEEGRIEEASVAFHEALELSEGFDDDDPRRVTSLNNLAMFLRTRGDIEKAVPLFHQALELREAQLGPQDPRLSDSYHNLAMHYQELGHLAMTRSLLEKALAIRLEMLENGQPGPAIETLNALGLVEYFQKEFDRARKYLQQALEIQQQHLVADAGTSALTHTNLGQVDLAQGRPDDAADHFRRALEIATRSSGPGSLVVARAHRQYARVLQMRQQPEEAEGHYEAAIEIMSKGSPDTPDLATSINDLAVFYKKQRRFGEAEITYRRALLILERFPDHPDLAGNLFNLARLYLDLSRNDEAEPLLKRALEIYGRLGHGNQALTRRAYAELLRRTGRDEEADRLLASTAVDSSGLSGP